MNEKKICFIVCTNNKVLLDECKRYIECLMIPDGFSVDFLAVEDAKSMTSGYNEAMGSTDAKYKIYMHQDVILHYKNTLVDIIDIFNSDSNIGMIGMVGYRKMSEDAIMWHNFRYGTNRLWGIGGYSREEYEGYKYSKEDGIVDVLVADGLLLATSTDIIWDERFDGWDYYDATQCIRFHENGYRVVVPNQRIPWFVHDDGRHITLWNYNKYRQLFYELYWESTMLIQELLEKMDNPYSMISRLELAIKCKYIQPKDFDIEELIEYLNDLRVCAGRLDITENKYLIICDEMSEAVKENSIEKLSSALNRIKSSLRVHQ